MHFTNLSLQKHIARKLKIELVEFSVIYRRPRKKAIRADGKHVCVQKKPAAFAKREATFTHTTRV